MYIYLQIKNQIKQVRSQSLKAYSFFYKLINFFNTHFTIIITNKQQMSYLCNKILTTVCPCVFAKKSNLSQFGDASDNQILQRQQFIRQNQQGQYKIKRQNGIQTQEFIGDFNKSPQQQMYQSTKHSPIIDTKKQQEDDEKLFARLQKQTAQLNFLEGDDEQQQQLKDKDHLENVSVHTKYTDYTNSLPKDHPYYESLYNKFLLIPSLFEVNQVNLLEETTNGEYPFKIYCKQSQIRKTNIFVYFFQLPKGSSYEAYESLLNDFQMQRKFDTNIDQYYKKIQSPDNKTKVLYLSYKKVLIIAPRDFYYVRYAFKKGHQNWSICTSIQGLDTLPNKTRGEIVLTATRVVEKQDQNGEKKLQVSVYSQVDMKMTIKPQMAKNKAKGQIKKYLDKCYKYLKENQQDENML